MLPDLTRRQLLQTTGALAAGTVIGTGTTTAAEAGTVVSFANNPFTAGVASGDPTPTSVILWTRLLPAPVALDMGMSGRPNAISVHWRVATTADRAKSDATSLFHGNVDALRRHGYSIHLDVAAAAGGGALPSNRRYFYEFSVPRSGTTGRWRSAGETRTRPRDDADVEVRFTVTSCQSFGQDRELFFNGHRHLVDRTANLPHFALFLGDYMYEFRAGWAKGDDALVLGHVANTLARYRQRYAWYKRRASLQRLHRRFPVYGVMDDHEFWNDMNGFSTTDAARFNAALQAYWENMPMRAKPVGTQDADGSLNTRTKGSLRLHRQVRWGKHLNLVLGDVRQHRHADGSTMLGAAQRDRLANWVTGGATWTAVAAGVPMAWFKGAGDVGWGRFERDRNAVTDAFFGRGAWNNIVLAGDVHCGMVNGVRRRKDGDTRYVATEFVTPPTSSNGKPHWADLINNDSASDGHVTVGRKAYVANGEPLRGYLQCNVTGAAWRSEFFLGDDVSRSDGAVSSRGVWKVTAGRVGAHQV